MNQIVLIAHNVRSTHNVGSFLRTADGLGISKVILSGYSPFPSMKNDMRLPHESKKIHDQIHKTALGAEETVAWDHTSNLKETIKKMKEEGFVVVALEQSQNSIPLNDFKSPQKLALIVGREVEGVEPEILKLVDAILEIPMKGKKESFNVSVAAAMALYHLIYYN